jgi:hypothetical protein
MPGMDARKGKLVVIGNLLHMDALLSRLRAPGTGFKVLEFPLITDKGICTGRNRGDCCILFKAGRPKWKSRMRQLCEDQFVLHSVEFTSRHHSQKRKGLGRIE